MSNSFGRFVNSILPSATPYDYTEKEKNIFNHISYMLDRTQSMFRWHGLPESIPARILELYLQVNGNACFYEYEGTLYVFTGGMGGPPDVYYRPTIYTIANPALGISKMLKIREECVVMPNDSLYIGLLPMFSKYATEIAETELSVDIANVNSRIVDLIGAPDDRTKAAAEKYLIDIREGRQGVLAENAFLDGLRSRPYGVTGRTTITDLIELTQYLKASWYNELGLNANYNMKRESLNSAESQLNDDALLPLVDDMLRMRQEYAEKVNEMFGTEISVELASAWEDNQEELDAEQDSLEAESAPDYAPDQTEEAPEEAPDEAPEEDTPEEVPEAALEDKIDDIREDIKDIKEIIEGGEDDGIQTETD